MGRPMTEQAERIKENVEAGIACPDCGSADVEATGIKDANWDAELAGCRDCGYVDHPLAFNLCHTVLGAGVRCPICGYEGRETIDIDPDDGASVDSLRRESDGWSTSREAVGWTDRGPSW